MPTFDEIPAIADACNFGPIDDPYAWLYAMGQGLRYKMEKARMQQQAINGYYFYSTTADGKRLLAHQDKQSCTFHRVPSGYWIRADAKEAIMHSHDVRRLDRLLAAHLLRLRILTTPSNIVSPTRVAKFRMRYMLAFEDVGHFTLWAACIHAAEKSSCGH